MGQTASLFDEPMPTWHDVEGTRTGERGAARLNDVAPHSKPHMTLYTNLMERRLVDDGSRNLFGWRKKDPVTGEAGDYEWVTYSQFLDQVAVMSAAMVHELGLKRQEPVGVFSKNRYEWVLVEHGVNRMAYQLVPLYDTLGPNAIPFILNQTEMRVVFVGAEQFPTLMKSLEQCPHVKIVVQFEDVDNVQRQQALARGVELKSLSEILEVGKNKPVDADPPLPSDIATIGYTSGTSGTPKGAMLTHTNQVSAGLEGGYLARLVPTDVHLSYLPLPHVLERAVQIPHIAAGAAIGFSQGDVTKLLDDLAALRPTTFAAVPRVLNRIHDRISQRVADTGGIKASLFHYAFEAKRAYLADGYVHHALWDKLVFGKIQQMIGGRVRVMMNASAPITQDCREFLQIVFSCPVIEGYGLTETSAVTSMSSQVFPSGPHVGGPAPGVQICLRDVPDMNYTSNDKPVPRGEICVKGPNVFKGYFKDPTQTAEVFDADGWFRTGDIGQWNADGTLSVIDRKKNIFKLSQGEYVAPEKIENIYMKSSLVAQVLVHGNSLQDYLVGVVIPDREVVVEWAKRENLGSYTVTDPELTRVLTSPELKQAILDDLERVAVKHGLFRFERVRKIRVETELWSVENQLLTPTFKIRRAQLQERFAKELESMYEEKRV